MILKIGSKIKIMTNIDKLLELKQEYPDLPIIPIVDGSVVGWDEYRSWLGKWGDCEVKKYYLGREYYHIFDDEDEEGTLLDIKDCKYALTPDGRNIYDLTDEEWKEVYNSLPWIDAIIVYIDAP